MIEENFDIAFIADLAFREKQIQQNYRPVIAVHKWFARRPGTLFRGLLLSEFSDDPVRVGTVPAKCVLRSGVVGVDTFAASFASGGKLEIDARVLGDKSGIIDASPENVAWLPTGAVPSFRAVADRIRALEASQSTYDCSEHICSNVVRVTGKDNAVFGECVVREIEKVRSFPYNCHPVMLEENNQVWVRAVTKYRLSIPVEAAPVTYEIELEAAASLGITDEMLIRAADNVLTKPPFLFEQRSVCCRSREGEEIWTGAPDDHEIGSKAITRSV